MTATFPLLDADAIAAARSADPAISKIGSREGQISFDWLRHTFKRDNGLKDQLKYGTAVLQTPDHLDQYLYTYGLMIQSQWTTAMKSVASEGKDIRLIDYGAGQGLAGVLLQDNLGDVFSHSVKSVLAIEPSVCALVRCETIYSKLFPNANVTCLNLMLDDLKSENFTTSDLTTVHVFSNVLDVPGFDPGALFTKSFTNGRHIVLTVSHDRDFAGGSGRIRGIEEEIRKTEHSSWVTVNSSSISEFKCGSAGKFAAISWIADITVER